jgi:hypothetical protein
LTPGTTTIDGIPIIETGGGVFDVPAATSSVQVGSARLQIHSCQWMTLSYTFATGSNQGLSGTIELARVAPAPALCTVQAD